MYTPIRYTGKTHAMNLRSTTTSTAKIATTTSTTNKPVLRKEKKLVLNLADENASDNLDMQRLLPQACEAVNGGINVTENEFPVTANDNSSAHKVIVQQNRIRRTGYVYFLLMFILVFLPLMLYSLNKLDRNELWQGMNSVQGGFVYARENIALKETVQKIIVFMHKYTQPDDEQMSKYDAVLGENLIKEKFLDEKNATG